METIRSPLDYFNLLYEQRGQFTVPEPDAAVLATATKAGRPSARVVLIKSVDDGGFVFYTNLSSRKAREIAENPCAALCFYWEEIHYQVRVEGGVRPVGDAEADAYFASRPRASRIGAWASKQSSRLASREQLQARFLRFEQEFAGKEVPRPEFWSGFRLIPDRYEFWLRRDDRLHERTLYVRQDGEWRIELLYP